MGLSSKEVSDGNNLDWSQIGNNGLEIGRQRLPCPRCESPNTKFCYYNNYSRLQPRHFCRACRRHWTAGGTLRNVPVGGGARKNKRPKSAAAEVSAIQRSIESPNDVLYQLMLRPPLVSSSDGSTISSSAVDWRDEAVVVGPLPGRRGLEPEDELLNLMPGGSTACPWPQDCWAWWDDVADPGLC